MFCPNRSPKSRTLLMLRYLAILLALQIVVALAPLPDGWKGIANYAPLHTLLETLSIVVSALVFAVGWSVYQRERSGNLMLLACCFAGVALLDVLHTLSYQGMPDFVTPSDPQKAIDFWLAARGLAALALCSVTVLPNWDLQRTNGRWWMLAGVLAAVAGAAWVVLFHADWVPETFVPGVGLTGFKRISEYGLITVYLALALGLYRRGLYPQSYDVQGLAGAAVVMALSEIFFTLYADVTDIFNLFGHLYKTVAYGMIYRAVFMNCVEIPYHRLYQSKQALAASEAKFHAIIDASPIAYLLYDGRNHIAYLNPAFVETFGYSRTELLEWEDWWRKAFPDAEYRRMVRSDWEERAQLVLSGGHGFPSMELDVVCKNGAKKIVLVNLVALSADLAGHQVVILSDITERVRALDVIWKQAHLDPLTELPNRSLFLSKLAQESAAAAKSGLRMALLFIDLDRFKDVNDTLGHFMGDILLREAARRLRQALPEALTLSRIGGDEFTVIIGGMKEKPEVEAIARIVLRGLAEPFRLGDDTVYLSASIGIAFYPDDARKSDELLKNADQALYEAKKRGRDRFSYFTSELQQRAQVRLRLLSELHAALRKDQFEVYYQPIVDMATLKIVKAEALLRWRHPALGMVSPAEFIPLAEETGLIVDIGEWVFDTVLQQAAIWRRLYHPEFQVSINKSPVQFLSARYDYKRWPEDLARMGISGAAMVVEITESLLLDANDIVREQLQAFHAAGIQVALDDFGTGYSSLTYLKKFDIDYIKIDQAFVRTLPVNASDMAVCEAIVAMAHKLGILVVAEGIETGEQLSLLQKIGCDFGQGYHFAKPMPAAGLTAIFEKAPGEPSNFADAAGTEWLEQTATGECDREP
ncbi:EAL domain-containing protein [Methylococcaceae bacterium WWC4]|nr:EAL domain-containing protein [Methylococcaceae bacterium WWC4]